MKKNKLLICGILVLLVFSACGAHFVEFATTAGGSSANDSAVFGIFDGDIAPPVAPRAAAPLTGSFYGAAQVEWEDVAGQNERHIIQNATLETETEEFDRVVAELRSAASDADGYTESEMLTNHGRRVFTIVMRIPAARFEEVLSQVQNLATVRSVNQHAQDVTDQFYNLAGNLETRRIEEERILALIEEAQDIHDLLALEMRLSNTRQTIESYLAQLNNMAGQIAFSTITVTLFDMYEEEIITLSPTLGERIGGAFGDSVDGTSRAAQNIIVFLAGAVIPVGFAGLFIFAVFFVVKLVYRKVNTPQ
ncbi:MAG: DUF4349 domain-containing protein [Defluviitaleaceae bacterium]|nr:DUF4349 domain-containing protein [Defluviitaleaceae bacterium]MCL2261999.1 DUF4349 domain-containing protein [Defluviitaleaceae bacterium]